jgi:hypothetical protein
MLHATWHVASHVACCTPRGMLHVVILPAARHVVRPDCHGRPLPPERSRGCLPRGIHEAEKPAGRPLVLCETQAHALCFLTVARVGFIFTGKLGTGLIVARKARCSVAPRVAPKGACWATRQSADRPASSYIDCMAAPSYINCTYYYNCVVIGSIACRQCIITMLSCLAIIVV